MIKFNWQASKDVNTYYASRYINKNGVYTSIRMHLEIMGLNPLKLEIDHIDGDGLNNQKCNLRLCTVSQNAMNRRIRAGGSSRYKGVHFDKGRNKWRVQISKNNNTWRRKRFDIEEDAARQYDSWAIELFGEFAVLNFPNDNISFENNVNIP